MGFTLQIRRCEYCFRRYSYNIDTGNFGLICPHCKKPQSNIVPLKNITPLKVLESLFKSGK